MAELCIILRDVLNLFISVLNTVLSHVIKVTIKFFSGYYDAGTSSLPVLPEWNLLLLLCSPNISGLTNSNTFDPFIPRKK